MNECNGECLSNACEDCLQRRQHHSHVAGARNAWRGAAGFIRKRAADLWILGGESEPVAMVLRSLAGEIEALGQKDGAELAKCIRESIREATP